MNKIKKVLTIIIVAIILIGVLLTVGIGNYFVNYAIARSGNGGNREIKEESKIEVLSEDEQLIEDNRKSANESAQNWASNIVNKKVEIKFPEKKIIGKVAGINDLGGLIILKENGKKEIIYTGELSHI